MESKQLIDIEKITWKTWVPKCPEDFPCFNCGKEIAIYRVKYEQGKSIITINICETCYKNWGPGI